MLGLRPDCNGFETYCQYKNTMLLQHNVKQLCLLGRIKYWPISVTMYLNDAQRVGKLMVLNGKAQSW